eukprot:COSAG05_NODE_17451_length_325_cov_0.681416_2_plen_30_part_01
MAALSRSSSTGERGEYMYMGSSSHAKIWTY